MILSGARAFTVVMPVQASNFSYLPD